MENLSRKRHDRSNIYKMKIVKRVNLARPVVLMLNYKTSEFPYIESSGKFDLSSAKGY